MGLSPSSVMIQLQYRPIQLGILGIDSDHCPSDSEDILWNIEGISTTTWRAFSVSVHQTPSPFLLLSYMAKVPQVFGRFYHDPQILVHVEIRDRVKTLHTVSTLPVKQRGEYRHIERQKDLKSAI